MTKRTHPKPPVNTKSLSLGSDNPDSDRRTERINYLENRISVFCQELYALGTLHIRPLPPYIIVRILPKEQTTQGGIILADTAQNKTLYEGIVLETWAPYSEYRSKSVTMDTYMSPPCTETIRIDHECSVKAGQRICFAHYEGLPVPYMDEKYYRMIRESVDQNKNPYMGVTGIIDYQGDKEITTKIRELMQKLYSVTTSGVAVSRGSVD